MTPEQHALREAVADFARRRIVPALPEGDAELPLKTHRELYAGAAELGLTGLLIPEEYGGGGGTQLDNALVAEELGAADAGIAAGLNLTMTVPGLLLAAGTPEQRARWLPDVAAGRTVLAGAMNEPDVAGSELFNPAPSADSGYRTRALRDGDGYVLHGAKAQWVTNAGAADAYVVFARTAEGVPGVDSTSAFWVPADAPGLSFGPRSRLLGLRTGFHAEVVLDGVRVPEDARIGPEGQALRLLMTSTPGMAVGLAAVFVGVARAAADLARAHTAERRSWGRPLREHQAVALELAELAVTVRAARLLVHEAARALDEGADPAELAVLVPAAKTRAVDAAIDCAQRAVRLHGATGVTTGAGPEKLLRDAWTGYACDFTRDMLHLGIAAALAAGG
ncbi:acyl-CoA dehydrogenase family protein [Actinomadura parmotrematis]|uniref:Acyl-CoA dehydrogenase family protein n=1 Tax=Actinomadura parmotrematis TaxID=2864039 RepID=A0ABS7FZH9_9ACTN|nr:acyl-CoA dehydrogenase family protein [Actinomadura parmotrematis]MBW8485852.1 acyl-CoA dehydrogenase family protein [Actinomadura parmotrematis]